MQGIGCVAINAMHEPTYSVFYLHCMVSSTYKACIDAAILEPTYNQLFIHAHLSSRSVYADDTYFEGHAHLSSHSI